MTESASFRQPGQTLLALCRTAEGEVLLVAPFIKRAALARILESISETVTVRCVTRWHPQEIAAGASDLEIWPLLKERPNSSLQLRQDLHAKFYRVDEQCLIGSANITLSALGWRAPPNFELLLGRSAQDPDLMAFERELIANAVIVNDAIYEHVMAAVECLPKPAEVEFPTETFTVNMVAEDNVQYSATLLRKIWIPTLRHPEDLFSAYQGHWEQLGKASQESAASDLQHLKIPGGLDKSAFVTFVGAMLLQEPVIQRIDGFVAKPRRFGAVKGLLASLRDDDVDFDASLAWQTLMRWLLYFLPERYTLSVPRHSEVFARKGPQ